MDSIEIYSTTFQNRPLRFIKGPRFEHDLPWWIAEDLTGCIAGLLGRPHLAAMLQQRMLEGCPVEDQTEIAADDEGSEIVLTAIAELQLVPVLMALSETDNASLAEFGEWMIAATIEARDIVGGNIALACSRRGISLDEEE